MESKWEDAVQVKLCSENQRAGELYRDHDQATLSCAAFYLATLRQTELRSTLLSNPPPRVLCTLLSYAATF